MINEPQERVEDILTTLSRVEVNSSEIWSGRIECNICVPLLNQVRTPFKPTIVNV